jgi:hypothetical protein
MIILGDAYGVRILAKRKVKLKLIGRDLVIAKNLDETKGEINF